MAASAARAAQAAIVIIYIMSLLYRIKHSFYITSYINIMSYYILISYHIMAAYSTVPIRPLEGSPLRPFGLRPHPPGLSGHAGRVPTALHGGLPGLHHAGWTRLEPVGNRARNRVHTVRGALGLDAPRHTPMEPRATPNGARTAGPRASLRRRIRPAAWPGGPAPPSRRRPGG